MLTNIYTDKCTDSHTILNIQQYSTFSFLKAKIDTQRCHLSLYRYDLGISRRNVSCKHAWYILGCRVGANARTSRFRPISTSVIAKNSVHSLNSPQGRNTHATHCINTTRRSADRISLAASYYSHMRCIPSSLTGRFALRDSPDSSS